MFEVSWLNKRSTGNVSGGQVWLISKVHLALNVHDDPPPQGSWTFTTGTWYTSFPVDDVVVEAGAAVDGAAVVVVVVVDGVVVVVVVVDGVVVDVVPVEGRLVTQSPIGILLPEYLSVKSTLSTPWCI